MTLSGVYWPAVLFGVTVATLFCVAVLAVVLITEEVAARQLDWILDRIENAIEGIIRRVKGWIERWQ